MQVHYTMSIVLCEGVRNLDGETVGYNSDTKGVASEDARLHEMSVGFLAVMWRR